MTSALRVLTIALLVLPACLSADAPPVRVQPQSTSVPYRILVTNDDGVRAPGIIAVAQALKAMGEVTVIAPADNQSGKSHSLQLTDPVYVDNVQLPGGLSAIAATGTPATCVKIALETLLSQKPNLVVSGINRGQNLGMTAYISGTVGAAREAALHGIPAIAASLLLARGGDTNYAAAAQAVVRIAHLVKERGLPSGVFLNVNVPSGPAEAIKGIRITRQSPQGGTETFIEHKRPPSGRRYYWNTYEDPKAGEDGDDVWAVYQGFVAVTPLRVGEFDANTFDRWKDLKD